MFAKLAEVEQRFLELSRQLEDPRVYSDPRRLQQLGRERKALEPVVETWRRYRQLQQEIEEYREALRAFLRGRDGAGLVFGRWCLGLGLPVEQWERQPPSDLRCLFNLRHHLLGALIYRKKHEGESYSDSDAEYR